MALVLLASGLAPVGVSAQAVDSPPVECPKPRPSFTYIDAVPPTQAGWVQHWIRQVRNQIPAVASPPVLMQVERNERVAVCLAVVVGPATEGLGTIADVAIVVVSRTATEELARFDSQLFSVQLPLGSATIDDNTPFFDYPPGRGPFLAIRRTAGPDLRLITELNRSVFTFADEVLAVGPETEDGPGRTRIDRLVLADRCGRFAFSVRVTNGVLVEVDGEGRPRPGVCTDAKIRPFLSLAPTVAIDESGLTLTSGEQRLVLSRSSSSTPDVGSALQYITGRTKVTRSTPLFIVRSEFPGGLRGLQGFGGCNSFATSIAFSESRFVLDSQRISTLALCPKSKPNAAVFVANPSGTGIYVIRGRTAILTFSDGATAVLGLRRPSPGA